MTTRPELTLKDTVYVIPELSLRRSKGQLADTVKQSTSLHLKSPDESSLFCRFLVTLPEHTGVQTEVSVGSWAALSSGTASQE